MRNATKNMKFLDDLAKMATGALGSFGDVKEQVKSMVKDRVEQVLEELDLVTRKEFERVEALAAKARATQQDLEDRIRKLEKQLKPAPKAKKPAKGKKK